MNIRFLILSVMSLFLTKVSFSQTPVDTTLFLQNIEIHGEVTNTLKEASIKTLIVEASPDLVTMTTSEAFRRLPSVITDIEGGLTYRGSAQAAVLLNGIPYGLMEEYNGDVLIQLPANFFNRLSVSSYPAIGLIPDGDAGILNLSANQFSASDPSLLFNLGIGMQERYNASLILNQHPGKFHVTGKYNYRREYRKRTFKKTTTTSTGTVEMDNSAAARPDIHLADLKIGYDLTPKDRITVYGIYHLMDYDRYGKIKNRRTNPAGEVMNYIFRNRYNTQKQEAYATEARWLHTFNRPGDQLEVIFNYNNFAYNEDNFYQNEHPETGNILAEDRLDIHHTKHNYYFSGLFNKQLPGQWFLKSGYTGRIKDENYTADAQDKKEEVWIPNSAKSDIHSFNRQTHMLFASVEKTWGNTVSEIGIQAEYSKQEIKSGETKATQEQVHLYPRLQFCYLPSSTGLFSLSYMQRVLRPIGTDLNPFIDISDATRIKQGNPDLENEIIHSVNLSYQQTFSHIKLTPAVYYRYRSNRIMDMLTEQNEQSIWRRENVGNTQTVGFELAGIWQPVKPVTVDFSGNIYRDEMDGRQVGYEDKKSLVCWDIKGGIQWDITPSTVFEVDGFFVSDQLTAQGKIKSHYSINTGISQYFLDKKLRANLSLHNIFDSLEEVTIIDTDQMHMRQERNRDARVLWLTFSYAL